MTTFAGNFPGESAAADAADRAAANAARPPFRADHVGSFLRPEAVKDARLRFREGAISAEDLRAVEDAAIRGLVARQKACGLRAVTDGELRRGWWHYDFFAGLDGVEKTAAGRGLAFHGVEPKAEKVVLTGRVGFTSHPHVADFAFLRETAGDTLAKMCIPSPAMLHMVLAVRDERFSLAGLYRDEDEFVSDMACAYRGAVRAFYDAGCRYLQLDDTSWGSLCNPAEREKLKKRGIDPDALARLYVDLNNSAIGERPADMAVTMHICRGNFRSTWMNSGGYEPVAEELFGRARLDGFFLEYDTERAGGFEPLRFIRDQKVVLGLVSSKTGVLEDREALKVRVAEAARFVPLEQLCLSPQCGFSSTEEGNILTEDEQWAKIRLVVETAGEIWE
ncbi:MAG: 5-methyltetrahydropteroyltriglutamate--homocysteine S-methyltransferase [Desulfovibrionaceae bacterium]|nr:5-methyltetrahydropteroyltriglutamate--homocysteine S-methyltransferase [Desulfovibrionaceae bacterium]